MSKKDPHNPVDGASGIDFVAGHNKVSKRKQIKQTTRPEPEDEERLIAVMGGSGTGKTTFVNLASGSKFRIGEGLESCTEEIEISQAFNIDRYRVRLIDTPGFDDSSKSDADILNLTAEFLAKEYKAGRKLSGVIYFHRISDVRIGGVARRNFTMFQKLCGSDALQNVILATTRWDKVNPEVGNAREEDLKSNPTLFKPVLDGGAEIYRHNGKVDSALEILLRLVVKQPTQFLIQKEMVDEGKNVADTAAGLELQREIMRLAERQKEEMRALLEELEDSAKEQDSEGLQDLEEEIQELRDKMVRLQTEAGKLSGAQWLQKELGPQSPPTVEGPTHSSDNGTSVELPSDDTKRSVHQRPSADSSSAGPADDSKDTHDELVKNRTEIKNIKGELQRLQKKVKQLEGDVQQAGANSGEAYRRELDDQRDRLLSVQQQLRETRSALVPIKRHSLFEGLSFSGLVKASLALFRWR